MKNRDLKIKMMKRVIDLACQGRDAEDGGPFGAVIVKDNIVIAECWNQVSGNKDSTQHAELRVIQMACAKLKAESLTGCTLYTSCEPCMMCLGAARWADIEHIYFAASADDAKNYGFVYSKMYYDSNPNNRHKEFNMTQLCREEAIKVWAESNK